MAALPERDAPGMAYLAQLQRDAAQSVGVDVSATGDEIYLKFAVDWINQGLYPPSTDPAKLAQSLRQAYEVPDPARWSPLERPDHRLRLWRAEQAVTGGLNALGKTLPSPIPALGTLPTWQLNAQAIPVPSTSSYIIAFDSGLVTVHTPCAGTEVWSKEGIGRPR